MHYTYAFAALGMISNSWAASLANPVELPASSDTQTTINQLRDQINRLADAVSQHNSINAKNSLASTDAQFLTVASLVKTPASFQCPASSAKCPTGKQDIIMGLRSTQSDLDVLALHAQNKDSTPDLINTNFCNACAAFQSLTPYIVDSAQGNATASPTFSISISTNIKSIATLLASSLSPTSLTSPPATASTTPLETSPTHDSALSTQTTTPTTTLSNTSNIAPPGTPTSPTAANTPPTNTNTPNGTAPSPASPSNLNTTYYGLLRSISTFNQSLVIHSQEPKTPDSYDAIEDLVYKWIAFDRAVLGPDANTVAVGCTDGGQAPARYTTPAHQTEALNYVLQMQEVLISTYNCFISQGEKGQQVLGPPLCAVGMTWPALAEWLGDYDLYNITGDTLDG